MDEETRRKREIGWLEVLLTYFQHELAHGHFFRTAIDNWSMYRKGGPFLNGKGGPRFFNKPTSNDERLGLMAFHSNAAMEIMNGSPVEAKLIVDHAVPVSVIHQLLRQSAPKSVRDIEDILIATYHLGVLTYEEDRSEKLAKSKMPEDWHAKSNDPFVRYEQAGIVGKINL